MGCLQKQSLREISICSSILEEEFLQQLLYYSMIDKIPVYHF